MMGGGIFGIIFIAIIIWGVFQFTGKGGINNPFKNNRMGNIPSEDNALEILKKRFARGEINTEEFESMKNDLT